MHLIHRMSNYFCLASAPYGNYDPAVIILSRISLALSCQGTGPMTRARMFTFAAYHPDTGPARHRA
jgi:hypothetical protein